MHRANWLKWEALHRLLQEALLELGADPAPQDKKVTSGKKLNAQRSRLNARSGGLARER